MITFEIMSIILLWVIVGTWISYKRNWYKGFDYNNGYGTPVIFNIVFAPISLIITLCSRLFYEPWQKN